VKEEKVILVDMILLGLALVLHKRASELKRGFVRGSLERHVTAREAAIAALAVIVLGGILSAEFCIAGIYTMSMPFGLLTCLMTLNLKEHLEDDDWFDNQKSRFKRQLKEIRKRRSAAVPQFSPT
jgi:hypothetical protein